MPFGINRESSKEERSSPTRVGIGFLFSNSNAYPKIHLIGSQQASSPAAFPLVCVTHRQVAPTHIKQDPQIFPIHHPPYLFLFLLVKHPTQLGLCMLQSSPLQRQTGSQGEYRQTGQWVSKINPTGPTGCCTNAFSCSHKLGLCDFIYGLLPLAARAKATTLRIL